MECRQGLRGKCGMPRCVRMGATCFWELGFSKAGLRPAQPEQHAASRARKGPILSGPNEAGACPLGSVQELCGTCSMNGLLASGCDADWQGWCNFAVRRSTDRLQCVLPLG